jgi:ketosteroid isomerase-like protein
MLAGGLVYHGPVMYSWIVGRLVRFLYGKVTSGDLRLPLLGLAKDARLTFPGSSSFGGEQRGKQAIEAWMRRFASLHPEFVVGDVAAAGPPWNMRVFMCFRDRILAPNGHVYENEGIEHIHIKYGLIREIRVHLDTEKVTALDANLGADGPAEAPRSSVPAAP